MSVVLLRRNPRFLLVFQFNYAQSYKYCQTVNESVHRSESNSNNDKKLASILPPTAEEKLFLKRKLNAVYTLYEQISGMDEVRAAQDKVIVIQEDLKIAQDKRRDLVYQLTTIRNGLRKIHDDILNYGRGDARYLELIRKEIDLTQKEKEILTLFNLADQEERDLFAHLTTAVKMSHEKERAQANTVKYWSLIGSIAGALLGILASALSYRYRNTQMEELKQQSKETVSQIISLNREIVKLGEEFREFAKTRDIQLQNPDLVPVESWSRYLIRNTSNIVRYIIPKRLY